VIHNRICEGSDCLNAVLWNGRTSLQVMVSCKKCGLGEQWSSDISVSCAYTGALMCSLETHVSEKFLIHTTNQTLHSRSRYLSASLTVSHVCEHFFRLLYYLYTSCQHDVKLSWIESMAYHPNFGFCAAVVLLICLIIIAALALYQAWICVGVGIGKYLTFSQIRHMVILFEF